MDQEQPSQTTEPKKAEKIEERVSVFDLVFAVPMCVSLIYAQDKQK